MRGRGGGSGDGEETEEVEEKEEFGRRRRKMRGGSLVPRLRYADITRRRSNGCTASRVLGTRALGNFAIPLVLGYHSILPLGCTRF